MVSATIWCFCASSRSRAEIMSSHFWDSLRISLLSMTNFRFLLGRENRRNQPTGHQVRNRLGDLDDNLHSFWSVAFEKLNSTYFLLGPGSCPDANRLCPYSLK